MPNKCSAPPPSFAAAQVLISTSLSKNLPSRMARVMRTLSWSTIRPAPRFWWPTSLLPIVSSGSPTSMQHVLTSVDGYSFISRSLTGVSA